MQIVNDEKVSDICSVISQECLKFLKEIKFGRSHDFSAKRFHHSGAPLNLYMEKILSILKVLPFLFSSCSVIIMLFYLK